MQGRFTMRPEGIIYFGPEMGGFAPFSLLQRTLARAATAFTQRRAPASHVSVGDKSNAQVRTPHRSRPSRAILSSSATTPLPRPSSLPPARARARSCLTLSRRCGRRRTCSS